MSVIDPREVSNAYKGVVYYRFYGLSFAPASSSLFRSPQPLLIREANATWGRSLMPTASGSRLPPTHKFLYRVGDATGMQRIGAKVWHHGARSAGRVPATLAGAAARLKSTSKFNQPLSGNACPRPGGIATFMRLPFASNLQGKWSVQLDAAVGGRSFLIGGSRFTCYATFSL